MALNIKDPRTDRLARELSAATGENLTTAIATALEERLERVRRADDVDARIAAMDAIVERYQALPVLDDRPVEELVPYGEHGEPI